jgi:hypothetical protein
MSIQTIYGTKIRFVTEDGLRWFRMRDITDFLEYKQGTAQRFYTPYKDKIRIKNIKVGTSGGAQTSLFVSESDLYFLIANTQRSQIDVLMTVMGITCHPAVSRLSRMFSATGCLRSYWVDGYKIDLYVPEYNIVIDSVENDISRTEKINDVLGVPEWIRYDPCADITDVIWEITSVMHRKFMTRVEPS